jgi:xanthine/uracil permease
VILVETSADVLAVGEIVDSPVDGRRLGDGLRADMLSSIVAPIFGGFTQSAFAQNVGLVAVTGIKSRFVVAFSGLILIVFGVLPVMGRIVACVPPPCWAVPAWCCSVPWLPAASVPWPRWNTTTI